MVSAAWALVSARAQSPARWAQYRHVRHGRRLRKDIGPSLDRPQGTKCVATPETSMEEARGKESSLG
eukprot:9131228-Alexandrium_andersonii.AAC.1